MRGFGSPLGLQPVGPLGRNLFLKFELHVAEQYLTKLSDVYLFMTECSSESTATNRLSSSDRFVIDKWKTSRLHLLRSLCLISADMKQEMK